MARPPRKPPDKPPAGRGAKPGLTVVQGGRGRGAPPHQPTEDRRTIVRVACLAGFTQQQIARLLQIDKNTLRKYYLDDLHQGGDAMMVKVVATLTQIATKPDHPKAVTAGIWLTRARLGWGQGDTVPRGGADEDEPDDAGGETGLGVTKFTLKLSGGPRNGA